MDIKKYVRKSHAHALVSVITLVFIIEILLGVMISHLSYTYEVVDAYSNQFMVRNMLESMSNSALKWLLAEFKTGIRPRAKPAIEGTYLTDCNSLRIFSSSDSEYDGVKTSEIIIYDLDYSADKIPESAVMSRIFPPSFKGSYMICVKAEKKNMAPMVLESVYEVKLNIMPDGSIKEILDTKPVYSRELFLSK